MRPISRRVLARYLAAVDVRGAACKGLGQWWSEQEAAHAAAGTPDAARAAANPAMVVCAGCPAITACSELAVIDRYTGLSAGAAYVNGRRTPTSTVVQTGPGSERRVG